MFYLISKRMKKLIKANKANRLWKRKQSTEKIKAKYVSQERKKYYKVCRKAVLQVWTCCCCRRQVASVVSDSVRSQRRQPTRLPHPRDSPGKNTGVGCHFLLQRMKVKSDSEVAESSPTLSDPMDCGPPGSSVPGILQARVLEWGAIAFSSVDLKTYKIKGILLTF